MIRNFRCNFFVWVAITTVIFGQKIQRLNLTFFNIINRILIIIKFFKLGMICMLFLILYLSIKNYKNTILKTFQTLNYHYSYCYLYQNLDKLIAHLNFKIKKMRISLK